MLEITRHGLCYSLLLPGTAVKLPQCVSLELHDDEKAKRQHLVFPANIKKTVTKREVLRERETQRG